MWDEDRLIVPLETCWSKVISRYPSRDTKYIVRYVDLLLTGEIRYVRVYEWKLKPDQVYTYISVWVEIKTSVEYEIAKGQHYRMKRRQDQGQDTFNTQTKYLGNEQSDEETLKVGHRCFRRMGREGVIEGKESFYKEGRWQRG